MENILAHREDTRQEAAHHKRDGTNLNKKILILIGKDN